MTQIQQLSDFIVNASFTDMSGFAVRALKTRLFEALRRGIWGTKDLWGRVVTFKE